MASPSSGSRGGRPPQISRERIVTRAREVIEGEGIGALTMRRLARDLGVSPMGLYHHVRDKGELLVLVLDAQVDEIALMEPDPDPRTRVLDYAVTIRGVLDARPWILEVITPGDLFAQRVLPVVDAMLAGLQECGLDPEAALDAYRSVWFLIVGELTVRHAAARRQAAGEVSSFGARTMAAVDPERLPTLAHAVSAFPRSRERYDARAALAALIDGRIAAG